MGVAMRELRRCLVAFGASCALSGLAGCAEVEEIMLEDVSYCYSCEWIIQEWDDPGWGTHAKRVLTGTIAVRTWMSRRAGR